MKFSESCRIEYIGFVEEVEQRAKVEAFCEKVYWSSPSNSFLSMAVCRSGGLYDFSLRISSNVGCFTSTAKSKDLDRALNILGRKIDMELSHWKHHRFQSEPMKPVSA